MLQTCARLSGSRLFFKIRKYDDVSRLERAPQRSGWRYPDMAMAAMPAGILGLRRPPRRSDLRAGRQIEGEDGARPHQTAASGVSSGRGLTVPVAGLRA